MVKHELRVGSLKARVEIQKRELKFKNASSDPGVTTRLQILDLRVRIHKLRVRIYKLGVRIHELKNHLLVIH